jgi:hypothetical protein
MSAKYFAILTNQGAAKLANATMLGTKLHLTQMAVGDANGALPTPDPAQTALISQKRIAPLNLLTVDPDNASQIIADQIIPENEGGFWIREIGLYDDDGVLIAVANCPETYKPQLQEGSGRTQTIRMILIVSSTAAVTLKIDPSVVLATRKYVDDAVIEVKAYADDVMKKHISAENPHQQYLLIANALKELADAGLIADVFKNLGLGSAARANVGDFISSGGGNYPAYLRMTGIETLATENAAANLSSLYSAPAPIPSGAVAAGAVANWYNYQAMWGIIRNASTGINGWGVQINGETLFLIAPNGDIYSLNEKLATETKLSNGLATKQAKDKTLTDLSGKSADQINEYLGLGSAAKKVVGNGPGQMPDMSYFPLSGGISGYMKLPNGFIFQWGQGNAGAGSANIPFPLMFPGGCVGVEITGTSARASTDMAGANIIAGEINAGGFGVNGYLIRPGGQVVPQGVAFIWCAWGY